MSAHNTVPLLPGRGHGNIDGNNASISDLPPAIIARLAATGVTTLTDWRGLDRGRFEIFGVTKKMVAQIDALARVRP